MQDFIDILTKQQSIPDVVAKKIPILHAVAWYLLSQVAIIVAMIFSIIVSRVALKVPSDVSLGQELIQFLIDEAIGLPIIMLLMVFMVVGVFVLALLFGGKEQGFIQYLSNFLWISAAFAFVNAVVTLIPVAGNLLGFFIALYAISFHVRLVAEYFSLALGRATIAYLIPAILFALVIFILVLIGLVVEELESAELAANTGQLLLSMVR